MVEKHTSTTAVTPAPSSKPRKPRRRRGPPPRRPASFASLPPELKGLIAEHLSVLEMTGPASPRPLPMSAYQVRDEVADLVMKEGKRSTKELARMMTDLMSKVTPCRSGLSTFSLLNRECFLIARPMLWEHLDLGDRTVSSLLLFLRDILPRHASLVRTLAFDYDSCIHRSGLTEYDDSFFPPEQKRYVKAAERIANLKPHRKLAIRRIRAPGVFVGEIIKQLVNLEEVDFAPFAPEDYDLNEHWNERWQDHAFQALVALKAPIKELKITVDCDVRDQVVNLERLFTNSTGLEKVQLQGAADEGAEFLPPYQAMFRALAHLSKLQHLTLELPIPPSFRQFDISWPLTSLCLDSTGPEAPALLVDFLSLFSSTLTNLEMRYVYTEPDEEASSVGFEKMTVSLPHLTRLAVAHSAGDPDAFLAPFAKCPIEVLRIEDCSAGAVEHVLSALETHKATLKKVQLLSAEYFMVLAEEDRARVREWCEKTGVAYEDVAPDDSDEETEEDPSEYGYGSDRHYEFDYSDEDEDEDDDEEEEEEEDEEEEQEEEDQAPESYAARERRYEQWRREQADDGWEDVSDEEMVGGMSALALDQVRHAENYYGPE